MKKLFSKIHYKLLYYVWWPLVERPFWWARKKLQSPPTCENCTHDMSYHTEYDSIGCIKCWENYVIGDESSDCGNYIKGDPWL